MPYQDRIARCFGAEDLKFGVHELDLQRGVELLDECVRSTVRLRDLKAAVARFLNGKTTDQDLISEQLQRIEECFSAWLDP
jgi:hypothetical protein